MSDGTVFILWLLFIIITMLRIVKDPMKRSMRFKGDPSIKKGFRNGKQ